MAEEVLKEADLAGPLVNCTALGICLLFQAKLHFGFIFGYAVFGCMAMYTVLNLMSRERQIELFSVCSVMGYCLLPIVIAACVGIVWSLQGYVGFVLSCISVAWCTLTCTRFFESAMNMRKQRFLIAYPTFLLYACFALITVF